MAERLEPELPLADVLVPIDSAAQLALAVVEVKGFHELDADGAIELAHRGSIFLLRMQRVAGGKDVARVEAHAHAIRIFRALQDRGQVLEPPAQVRALPGRILQQTFRLDAGRLGMHFVQGLDHAL